MENTENPLRKTPEFSTDTSGGMTAFGLFICIGLLFLGGYAVDLAHVMTARTHMQVAADSAAHAAIVTRELKSEAEARQRAHDIVHGTLPPETYGTTVTDEQITFGRWEPTTLAFTPQPGSREAVRVRVSRTTENNNPIPTFLLHLLGQDRWNITREAILLAYMPACLQEGFVAEGVVDIQSNNTYVNGFCIHSNTYVKLSSGNYFETGVMVSMPDINQLQLPNAGFSTNPGLEDAIFDARMDLRILDRLDEVVAGLTDPDSPYYKSYITDTVGVNIGGNTIRQQDVREGSVHRKTCNGGGQLSIDGGTVFRNAILITNCRVSFNNGAAVENAVVVTTNTNKKSFNGPNGVRLGLNDNCAPGGGAQLISYGGMEFAAGLEIYGSQLIAAGDISFSASSNGIQGASLIAGGTISGTSNMTMGFCNGGMESNLDAKFFRLTQ